jgi:hypothetical protein
MPPHSICRAVALLPGIGDIINAFLNYWLILAQAQKAECVSPPRFLNDLRLTIVYDVQAPGLA